MFKIFYLSLYDNTQRFVFFLWFRNDRFIQRYVGNKYNWLSLCQVSFKGWLFKKEIYATFCHKINE